MKTTDEKIDAKPAISFLSIDAKADLITKLKSWGINSDGLSDIDLVTKVAAYAEEVNNKLVEKESDGLQRKLNDYAAHNPLLTDKDFILRLYNMNVLPMWLPIFTDADGAKLPESQWRKQNLSGGKQGDVLPDGKWLKEDARIWAKIRAKGRPQLTEARDIFGARYKLPDLSKTKRYVEDY